MIINHNLMAMNTHRQLSINNSMAQKSIEKLSSGYRINRAGDDAAGLSISEKMRAQIRGLNQASRNAQDGISLIQTAEGALSETHAILQRMRELAVQAANDTNVEFDRNAIQQEVDQLITEIDRIASTTEFNTQKLLNGAFKSQYFQIGANENQTLSLSISRMDTAGLSLTSSITIDSGNTNSVKLADGTYRVSGGYVYDASNNNVGKVSGNNKVFVGGTSVVALTNDKFEDGSLITISEGGTKFTVKGAINGNALTMAPGSYEIVGGGNILKDNIIVGKVSGSYLIIDQADGSKLTVTAAQLGVTTNAITSGTSFTINGVDVSNRDSAMGSITAIDNAIKTVSEERAKLGAYQNRLEHTIKNLDTSAENLQASESRIRDVDMAKEMMNFTKLNILQQAATAMLAQANQAPQTVLQLLR